MNLLAYLLLLFAPLVIAVVIILVRTPMSVAMVVVGGWLFLPEGGFSLPGLPDYSKAYAISIGTLLGCAIARPNWFFGWKPALIDVPALLLCVTPMASSVTNGLGPYDGASASFQMIVTWGIPYLIGRCVFRNFSTCRTFAIACILGGLVYLPLCVWEIRMSPTLHPKIYGFDPRRWAGYRLGGYRPEVFLESGLTLGMWMTSATMVAIWMWGSRGIRRLYEVPMGAIASSLFVITVMCRSLGALALLLFGIGVYAAWRTTKARTFLIAPAIAVVLYMGVRSTGMWHGEPLTQVAEMIDEDRAASFSFRLEQEDILVDKALKQPLFGWGGWGRYRVYDDYGRDISTTDGLWVIRLGQNGIVGLFGLYGVLLVPASVVLWRFGKYPRSPLAAAPMALAMVTCLWAADNLLNAMYNPIYIFAAGSLASVARITGTRSRRASPVKRIRRPTGMHD